jgi:hypothetical protein
MRAKGKPRHAAGRAVLGGVAASLVLGLAACGSVAAGAGGQSGHPAAASSSKAAASRPEPPLCANLDRLTRLVVGRSVGLTHVREVQPGGLTISNPHVVRSVAATLCALPPMPRGPVACPAILGGSYKFWFVAAKRAFPPITVQATGCHVVTGLGHPDRRVVSEQAWVNLTSAFSQAASLIPGKHASVLTP